MSMWQMVCAAALGFLMAEILATIIRVILRISDMKKKPEKPTVRIYKVDRETGESAPLDPKDFEDITKMIEHFMEGENDER